MASFLPIGGSGVTSNKNLSTVHINSHCYGVSVSGADLFTLLGFNKVHGYAPPLIFAKQLATGLDQDGYSLFNLSTRLTITEQAQSIANQELLMPREVDCAK
jgi:hypothetical protein